MWEIEMAIVKDKETAALRGMQMGQRGWGKMMGRPWAMKMVGRKAEPWE